MGQSGLERYKSNEISVLAVAKGVPKLSHRGTPSKAGQSPVNHYKQVGYITFVGSKTMSHCDTNPGAKLLDLEQMRLNLLLINICIQLTGRDCRRGDGCLDVG